MAGSSHVPYVTASGLFTPGKRIGESVLISTSVSFTLSNRTCGFPASGSPTGFTVRHAKQITDRKRHLHGVLSSFASRHSFL